MRKIQALLLSLSILGYTSLYASNSNNENEVQQVANLKVATENMSINQFAPCDPALPVPEITVDEPSCEMDGKATIINYDPSLTYLFMPSGPSVGFGGEITGMDFGVSYEVIADDGTCTSDVSEKVSIDPKLTTPATPTVNVEMPTCFEDGFAEITNYLNHYTYVFVPAGPTVNAEGVVENADFFTSYIVHAITADGCLSGESSFAIEEQLSIPEILSTVTNPSACGANGTVDFLFTNLPDGNYTLNYDSGSEAITVNQGSAQVFWSAGVYSNIIINNGICDSEPVTVTVLDPNSPEAPVITTIPATCEEDEVSTIANYNSAYSYTFSPTGPSVNASGVISNALPETTYVVSAEENGCTSATTFENDKKLETPVLQAVVTQASTCGGNGRIDFVSPGITDGTYTVSHDDGSFSLYFENGASYVFVPAGNYTNLVIDNGTCTSEQGVSVTVATATTPAEPVITVLPISCIAIENGKAVIEDYNPDYIYTFSPTGPSLISTGEIINATPGIVYEIQININGCLSAPTTFIVDAWNDGDCDGDGVTNGQEIADGTDPFEPCSYLATNQVNPSQDWLDMDCDGDGVTNGQELIDGTNPLSPCDYLAINQQNPSSTWLAMDCDGDGVTNGDELADGTNPLEPCDFVLTSQTIYPSLAWANGDCDGDGVTNGQELLDGTDPTSGCDFDVNSQTLPPSSAWANGDCDGDGVSNGQEIADGTDPQEPCDYDVDNQLSPTQDWLEMDCDGDGVTNGQELADNTNPKDPCDYLEANQGTPSQEWLDLDCDGDGVTNGDELADGTDPLNPCELVVGSQTLTPSNAWLAMDCDGDGVTNGTELTDGTSPLDMCDFILASQTATPSVAWNSADCDGDGVSNADELTDGTDPLEPCDYEVSSVTLPQGGAWANEDCDGDGISNGDELANDSDPLDACSPNATVNPAIIVSQPSCETGNGSVSVSNPETNAVYTLIGPTPSDVETNATGTFVDLVSGQYSISVVAHNCPSGEVTFTIDAQPNFPQTPAVSLTNADCDGDGSATISNYDASYTYVFTPADGITVTSSGEIVQANTGVAYSVYAVNAADCQSTPSPSFVIEQQYAAAADPVVAVQAASCGENGTASVSNHSAEITYVFSPTGPVVNSLGEIHNVVFGQAYTITAKNTNGCESDDVNFTVASMLPVPQVPVVSVDPASCTNNGLAEITNYQAGVTYVFTPSNGVSVNTSGEIVDAQYGVNYTVLAQSTDGCSSTTASFVVQEMLETLDAPEFTIVDPTCTANGSAVVNNHQNGYTYTISPSDGILINSSGIVVNPTFGVEYNISVNSYGTCASETATLTVEAKYPTPTLSVTAIQPADCNDQGVLNFIFTNVPDGDYTIDYNGGSLDVTVQNNTASVEVGPGQYNHLVINNGNCTSGMGINANIIAPSQVVAPIVTVFDYSCVTNSDGYTIVSNYNASNNYVFSPTGPYVNTQGMIEDAELDVAYTAKVVDGSCESEEVAFMNASWGQGDCDGDGVTNGQELADGTDPKLPCDFLLTSQTLAPSAEWLAMDCDGDGVTNGDELTDGTNPLESCDLVVASQTVTPSIAWQYGDCDGDGVTNQQEVEDETDPFNPCSLVFENQNLPSEEWLAMDCDGDGVLNGKEIQDGTHPLVPCDYVASSVTEEQIGDWLMEDCDGDGVINADEVADGTDPQDPCDLDIDNQTVEPSQEWLDSDCDGDGVSNGEELALGTNPFDPCSPNVCKLSVPSVFTPDGDGINDVWRIEGIENHPTNTLVIYNRWGNIVYEAEGYLNTWDGTSVSGLNVGGEELPTGAYYYVLDTKDENIGVLKGYVQLKR